MPFLGEAKFATCPLPIGLHANMLRHVMEGHSVTFSLFFYYERIFISSSTCASNNSSCQFGGVLFGENFIEIMQEEEEEK